MIRGVASADIDLDGLDGVDLDRFARGFPHDLFTRLRDATACDRLRHERGRHS
jgi:hypothetical protein